jgi:uncharacterized protein (TIGR03437 family)
MTQLIRCEVIFVMLTASGVGQADELFYARDFLYTRQFKMGSDVAAEESSAAYASGNLYVAAAFHFPSYGFDVQGFMRRYDASGNEVWTRQMPVTNAFPSKMAADAAFLYVAGSIGFGGTDFFLSKYDTSGNELWSRRARITEGGYHVVTGLALDASGIYVAVWDGFKQCLLRKYSPAGDELFSRTITVFTSGGVAVEASGVYLLGWTDSTSGFVRKYLDSGGELWTRTVDTGKVCQCVPPQGPLTADSTGVYVGGAVMTKLDRNGNVVWKRPFAASAEGSYSVRSIALDSTGLYVSGGTERALPGQCKAGNGDVFVRMYDIADGTERWTRQFGTWGRDFPGSVTLDATGVYVTGAIRGGTAHGNVFVAKLAKTPAQSGTTGPQIAHECVVNAASYAGGGVAPGEIVTIFGQGMGPPTGAGLRIGADGALTTTLSDTRVLFDDIPAPLIYVSATQSSAIVPRGVADKSTVGVAIEYTGVRSEPLTLPVEAARPGVFTADRSGYGQGAILNEDGSLNSAANPAKLGSIIVVYLTGEGLIDPPSADGAVNGVTLPKPRSPVSVGFPSDPPTCEGAIGEVIYAGGVMGSVAGLLQVNVRVPESAQTGSAVPFFVQIGGESAEAGFTVALR